MNLLTILLITSLTSASLTPSSTDPTCYNTQFNLERDINILDEGTKNISGWEDGRLLNSGVDKEPNPWSDKCREDKEEIGGPEAGSVKDFKSCMILVKLEGTDQKDEQVTGKHHINTDFGLCSKLPAEPERVSCSRGDCRKGKVCRCRYPFGLPKDKMVVPKDVASGLVADIFIIRQCWGNFKTNSTDLVLRVDPDSHQIAFDGGGRLIDDSTPVHYMHAPHGGCAVQYQFLTDVNAQEFRFKKSHLSSEAASKDSVVQEFCATDNYPHFYKCIFSYPYQMPKEKVALSEEQFRKMLETFTIKVVSCYTGTFRTPKNPWRDAPTDGEGALWSEDDLKDKVMDCIVLGVEGFCLANVTRDGEEIVTTHSFQCLGLKNSDISPGCEQKGSPSSTPYLDCYYPFEEVKTFQIEGPDRDYLVHRIVSFRKCHHLLEPYLVDVDEWNGMIYDKDVEAYNCSEDKKDVTICSVQVSFTAEDRKGIQLSHSCEKAVHNGHHCTCQDWARTTHCVCQYGLGHRPAKVEEKAIQFFKNPLQCFSGSFSINSTECQGNGGWLWKEDAGLEKVRCFGSLHCEVRAFPDPSDPSSLIQIHHGCAPLAHVIERSWGNWTSDWSDPEIIMKCEWRLNPIFTGAVCDYRDTLSPERLTIDKRGVRDALCGSQSIACPTGAFKIAKDQWEVDLGSLWKKEALSETIACVGSETCMAKVTRVAKDVGEVKHACSPPPTIEGDWSGKDPSDPDDGAAIKCLWNDSPKGIACRFWDDSDPDWLKVRDAPLRARLWTDVEPETPPPTTEDKTKGLSSTATDRNTGLNLRSGGDDEGSPGGRMMAIVLGILGGLLVLLLFCVYALKTVLKCTLDDGDDGAD